MPKPAKGPRLGGSPAHERLMLANLATALFEHRSITTTETKAKRLRPFAERLITKAKRGDLHARRQVHSVIGDKNIVHRLFTELGPDYAARPGGYTRITKIGPRRGDSAPMAVIELVDPLRAPEPGEAEPAVPEPTTSAPTVVAEPAAAAADPAALSAGSGALTTEPVATESTEATETVEPIADDVALAESTESSDEAVPDEGAEPAERSQER